MDDVRDRNMDYNTKMKKNGEYLRKCYVAFVDCLWNSLCIQKFSTG